jgi:hypothetical protein
MTNTRYGHTNVGGGDQDQPERKDEGWERRQGGPESRDAGRRGNREARAADNESQGQPPPGTNTQGELAGIGDAAEQSKATLAASSPPPEAQTGVRERDLRAAGTDQPPRMGGPLGPDADNPHLPEGAQDADSRGTGAGDFDRGVNAKVIGAVHQGARPEDPRSGER